MGEDYNTIIEDFRARGKSDQYIANFLVYNPKYNLDVNTANALLNIGSKKKKKRGEIRLLFRRLFLRISSWLHLRS